MFGYTHDTNYSFTKQTLSKEKKEIPWNKSQRGLNKKGNLTAKVKSFVMLDSFNFNVEIEKNQKVKYLQLSSF